MKKEKENSSFSNMLTEPALICEKTGNGGNYATSVDIG